MQNNILTNINSLLAKLTEKQYAPYKKMYEAKKEMYDKRYEEIFGVGQNKLYLTDDYIKMSLRDFVETNMDKINFAICGVILNTGNKYGFKDKYSDLLNNRIFGADGREYRLTKLLKLISEHKIKGITDEQYESIDRQFDHYSFHYSNNRSLIDDYISALPSKEAISSGSFEFLIVLSKDPYDVAGMSTDRRWTSCMRLPSETDSAGGGYHDVVKADVELGTIVAYLISPDDKNINKPYARIAIKPYFNIKNNSVRLFAEGKQYHDNSLPKDVYSEFARIVDKVLEEIQDPNNGLFIFPKELYNDSRISYKTVGPKEDLITSLSIKKLFDCDESGTGYIKKAFAAQYKYTPYEYFFSDLVNNFGTLFDYRFRSSIKEYNIPEFNHIPMLTFVPTFENYYNKVINIGEATIKVSQLPQFLATLDNNNRKFNQYQQERYDKMMDRINLAIKNITEYDVTDLEDLMKQYDIFIEFNDADGKPKQKNVNVVTKLNGGMSTRYGDDLNDQQTYQSALSIYIIESGKSVDQYMVREDLTLTFEISEKLNGLQYRDFMSVRVYSYADLLITNLHHTSGNATLSNLDFKFALKHYLDDYYYSKLDSKYIGQENTDGK